MDLQPFEVTASGARNLSRKALRGSSYVLTSRGVRLPRGAAEKGVARIAAAVLPLKHRAAVCGPTAALLLGLPITMRLEREATAHVHVLIDRGVARPQRRDLIVRQGPFGDDEVVRRHGLLVTSDARTYVDLAAVLVRPDLAAVGDVVLRRGCSPQLLREIVERRGRYPGKVLARSTLDWLDPGAESPQESRLRVVLREAGLPRPRVNAVIRDAGAHPVARGDLVFDEAMLVVEYDGADHLTPERQRRDAERRANLQALGWMVLELNRYDLVDSRRAVAKVRAALLARGVRR